MPAFWPDIKRLGAMNTRQFVVCPGLNDGEALRQSIGAGSITSGCNRLPPFPSV